jgi:hypothetical protein
MDGNVVHLTDQSVVKYVVSDETEEVEESDILTADQWKSTEKMIKTGDPKIVDIDVTEKSKEVQQNIHKTLRVKYEDVSRHSGPVDGKTIMKSDGRRMSSVYTQFVLYKENLSTVKAVELISRLLKYLFSI